MAHFDLCVIGSGTGNSLITPDFDDWSIALVDGAPRFGGTCLNAGCIPTKMFSVAADTAEQVRAAGRLGVSAGEASVDWTAVRDRVFGRIDPIVTAGEAYRRGNPNVTLVREMASFVAPGVLQAGDQTITAERFVLAAGSRPRMPDVPGVDDPALAGLLHTSESIMRLAELPASLVIIGGGVVALEFAHIFAAFGTRVTIVHRGERLLREADAEVAGRLQAALGERVTLRLGQRLTGLAPNPRGGVAVQTVDSDGIEYEFDGELALIAIGRIPNSDTLGVAQAGIATDAAGRVVVDAHQRTNVPGVWALGDICAVKQLKHVANHQARVVAHNLAHPDDLVASDLRFVPKAVFSAPQLAWVGLTQAEAEASGVECVTSVRSFDSVAYGWALEDDGTHVVKLLATPAGELLGAHIVGPQAAVLLQPLIQAMSTGLDVRTMARGQYWIHPALTEVVENALLDLPLAGEAGGRADLPRVCGPVLDGGQRSVRTLDLPLA